MLGVGGAGGNALNNMIASQLEGRRISAPGELRVAVTPLCAGVEFVCMNTDAQALSTSLCDNTIQLGKNQTNGLGAGAKADAGALATRENACGV